MKKVILGLALLTFTVAANAQNEGYSKGSTFITGGVGISSENDKDADSKTNELSISPSIGYFVSDNIAIGVGLGIGSSKTSESGTDVTDMSTLTVGGFARYYFTPKSKFSMFGHLGINYASMKDNINDAKATGTEFFVAPGMNYFISNKLSLEAVIGKLGYSSVKADGAKGTTNFGLGLDLSSVSFGVNYKF